MTNAEHADEFVAKNIGQYIDEDKSFGSQCWDVPARYAREEYDCPSFPTVSGGAEGLFRFFANPIPQYFDKIAGSDLQKGDVGVCDSSFYPPWGHTFLVWEREGDTVWCFEQDGSKDPNGDGIADGVAYLVQRKITSKMNGLRPKGDNSMYQTDEEADRAYTARLHRRAETVAAKKGIIGKTGPQVDEAMISSKEWLLQNHILLKAYPDAVTLIASLQDQVKALKANGQSAVTQDEIDKLTKQADDLEQAIKNVNK